MTGSLSANAPLPAIRAAGIGMERAVTPPMLKAHWRRSDAVKDGADLLLDRASHCRRVFWGA